MELDLDLEGGKGRKEKTGEPKINYHGGRAIGLAYIFFCPLAPFFFLKPNPSAQVCLSLRINQLAAT